MEPELKEDIEIYLNNFESNKSILQIDLFPEEIIFYLMNSNKDLKLNKNIKDIFSENINKKINSKEYFENLMEKINSNFLF